MPTASLNYRDMLKMKLADAVAANPSFSLRAMAKKIKVSPSLLCEVLNGRKRLSIERAFVITKHLKLGPAERELFLTLVEFERAKSDDLKIELAEKLECLQAKKNIRSLDVDLFRTISEWYHIAILELTGLQLTDMGPRSIAGTLGISITEAQAALDRLVRLNLLRRGPDGRLLKTNSRLLIDSSVPSEALRRYHRQMLVKAAESLTEQDAKEKFVGSETFAMSKAQLKEAEAAIERCFEEVVRIAGKKSPGKAVYHFGIQLFKLSRCER